MTAQPVDKRNWSERTKKHFILEDMGCCNRIVIGQSNDWDTNYNEMTLKVIVVSLIFQNSTKKNP